MDIMSSFQRNNLYALMLKHMNKVVNEKKGIHGLPYGFLLNKVFKYFQAGHGTGISSSRKHMFTISMLGECEIVKKKKGVSSHSDM